LDAETFLEQIKMIDGIIVDKMKDYTRWKEIADGYAGGFSVSDVVQTSKDPQNKAKATIEYVNIENEIKALRNKRQGIISTMQKLPYFEYRILYEIYVNERMVKELPSIFKRSYEWVKVNKRQALDRLDEIINKSIPKNT
jgi:hypothetical protein